MDDDAHIAEIEKLEARIEALAEEANACRKLIMASRVALIVGCVWIVASIVGFTRMDALQLVTIFTLIIGGIVFFGSNKSTLEEKLGQMREAEARRAELIGAIRLRIVH
ncbi:MAG: hypothetical protein Q8M31_00330 [Beijerinckiaceae bacterium]|nr:hypothetical protein [Beijerinckiaceae bacterium]